MHGVAMHGIAMQRCQPKWRCCRTCALRSIALLESCGFSVSNRSLVAHNADSSQVCCCSAELLQPLTPLLHLSGCRAAAAGAAMAAAAVAAAGPWEQRCRQCWSCLQHLLGN